MPAPLARTMSSPGAWVDVLNRSMIHMAVEAHAKFANKETFSISQVWELIRRKDDGP